MPLDAKSVLNVAGVIIDSVRWQTVRDCDPWLLSTPVTPAAEKVRSRCQSMSNRIDLSSTLTQGVHSERLREVRCVWGPALAGVF